MEIHKLVYYEVFKRLDEAFEREKQIQGWSRAKKQALIYGQEQLLHGLSVCKNASHFKNKELDKGHNPQPNFRRQYLVIEILQVM